MEDQEGKELLVNDDDNNNNVEDEGTVLENDGLVVTGPTMVLQGMEAPQDFQATLRPYQRQALWWMTQREEQRELEESSKQQLELLEELVQSNTNTLSTNNNNNNHKGTSAPIHCECGPVQVDISQIPAPAVNDEGGQPPDMKHPLWERRFLTNAAHTEARSFYVQPLFGAAMASPPEPPRPCRGGILADSMGLVRLFLSVLFTSFDR